MKICLIGDGITNQILAIFLVKRKIKVDLYSSFNKSDNKKTRTIGLTNNNKKFLEKNINNFGKLLWPINSIKIFNQSSQDKEIINFNKSKEAKFYIFKNNNFKNLLKKKLNKNKYFSKKKIKSNSFYSKVIKMNYDIIINSDYNNIISSKFFNKKIDKDYKSTAYTTIVTHKSIHNHEASQVFTNIGPLAFLPLSNTRTSIVYSIKNSSNITNENEITKLIKKYNLKYNILDLDKIEKFNVRSSFLKNYYHLNILAFGDLLHRVHPFAGQGFNMTIRDIKSFIELVDNRISLGLAIDKSLLHNFEKKNKSINLIFGTGLDLVNQFFIFDSKISNNLSNKIFPILNKSKFFKNYASKFADQGINL